MPFQEKINQWKKAKSRALVFLSDAGANGPKMVHKMTNCRTCALQASKRGRRSAGGQELLNSPLSRSFGAQEKRPLGRGEGKKRQKDKAATNDSEKKKSRAVYYRGDARS